MGKNSATDKNAGIFWKRTGYSRGIGIPSMIGLSSGSGFAVFVVALSMERYLIPMVLLSIIIACAPLLIAMTARARTARSIDSNAPAFLLQLLMAVKNGHTIISALEQAVKQDNGDRGKGSSNAIILAVKRFLINISSGCNIDHSFAIFEHDMFTDIGRNVVTAIRTVFIDGGDAKYILENTHRQVSSMYSLEMERRSKLAAYKHVVYISYIVYVAIVVLISTNLFEKIEEMNASADTTSSDSLFRLTSVNIGELRSVMMHMAIIEAIFGGIGIGKICDNSIVSGIRHSLVMILICMVAFYAGGVA